MSDTTFDVTDYLSADDMRQMIEERVTTAIFERLRGTRHEKETWREA